MALIHVIDDEKFICELLSKMLFLNGYEVETFQDPHLYLQHIDQNPNNLPSAIITDLYMPSMDGCELINQVMIRHDGLKFILISGAPRIDNRIQHQACHYLCKPFRVTELIGMIEKITRCNCEGPSAAIGCSSMGDRTQFVSEWHCPVPQPRQA